MTFRPSLIHQQHDGPAKGLATAADRIASGGADGMVKLMTVGGDHIGSYRHDDIVNAVAVGPRGRVASASRDRTIRLWGDDAGRGYVVGEHDHWAMTIAWSPDGDHLVSGSEDSTIGFWNPDGSEVQQVEVGSPVNGIDWRGDVIAAATGDRRLLLLEPDGSIRREMKGPDQMLWSVALSPQADRVAWVGRDRRLWLVDDLDAEPHSVPAHTDQIWSVAWSQDGGTIATAAADGTVALWSSEGEALERIAVGPWARRALFVGKTLLLVATEEGDLKAFADDGGDAATPARVEIPDSPRVCEHWDPQVEETDKRACEDCGSPNEMRLCVTCGHVGCCESQLAHGTKHWLETGHANTVPVSDGPPNWRWCYPDDMYVKRTA